MGRKTNQGLVLDRKKREQILFFRLDNLHWCRADTQGSAADTENLSRGGRHCLLFTRLQGDYQTAGKNRGWNEGNSLIWVTGGDSDSLILQKLLISPFNPNKHPGRFARFLRDSFYSTVLRPPFSALSYWNNPVVKKSKTNITTLYKNKLANYGGIDRIPILYLQQNTCKC